MRIAVLAVAALVAFGPVRLAAQDSQTLADIRQELSILHVEVQKLRRELSTTGTTSVDVTGNTVLDRVAAIEAELQRLTAQTESLGHRIERVVTDGTNRIGDLEFRLVELEGGDVSTLGETTTLGGADTASASSTPPPPPAIPLAAPQTGTGGELAVGEKADFDAAMAALSSGDTGRASELFNAFNLAYPGSPLAPEANLNLGKALEASGDTRRAAQAYLAGFTAGPTGPVAPETLQLLGASLGKLGKTQEACVTLAEVGARFPTTDAAARARAEMVSLGCP